LTATDVSFWDWLRPKNPGADWFVHSWLARTFVADELGQPPEPVLDGGMAAARILAGSADSGTALRGSTALRRRLGYEASDDERQDRGDGYRREKRLSHASS
jgi:hypothetical protein